MGKAALRKKVKPPFDDCLNPVCTGTSRCPTYSGWFDFGKTLSMSEGFICGEFFSVLARIEK